MPPTEYPRERGLTSKRLTVRERAMLGARSRSAIHVEPKNLYDQYYGPVAALIERLFGILDNELVRDKKFKYKGHYATGPKLDIRKAMTMKKTGDMDIWLRRVKPTKRSFKFSIILDESGSMGGGKSEVSQDALKALVLFMEVLSRLEIDFSLIGFDNAPSVHKHFNEQFKHKDKNALLTEVMEYLSRGGSTYDAAAVQMAIGQLEKESSDSKVIIVITDGCGTGPVKVGKVIREAREKHIEVIGVGIGAGMHYVSSVYLPHVTVATMEELPQSVAKLLIDIIVNKKYVPVSAEPAAAKTKTVAANLFSSGLATWLARVLLAPGIAVHEAQHCVDAVRAGLMKLRDIKAAYFIEGIPVRIGRSLVFRGMTANLAVLCASLVGIVSGLFVPAEYLLVWCAASNAAVLASDLVLPLFRRYRYGSDLHRGLSRVLVGLQEGLTADVRDKLLAALPKFGVDVVSVKDKEEFDAIAARDGGVSVYVDSSVKSIDTEELKKDLFAIKISRDRHLVLTMSENDTKARRALDHAIRQILPALGVIDMDAGFERAMAGYRRSSRGDALPDKAASQAQRLKRLVRGLKSSGAMRASYYEPMPAADAAGRAIALATTESVFMADPYAAENMEEAAANGIVNYMIYGDKARTEDEARKLVAASGYSGPQDMIRFIKRTSWCSDIISAIVRSEEAEGRMIAPGDIGIRAAVNDGILADGERPGEEKILLIERIEIGKMVVLAATRSYPKLLKLVISGELPPDVTKDSVIKGVYIYLPRTLPIDSRKMETYQRALEIIWSAA